MPFRTRALEILEQWREVEGLLQDETNPERRARLDAEMDFFRRRYHDLMVAALAPDVPQPPPFPVAQAGLATSGAHRPG